MLSGLDDTAKITEISNLRGALNAIKLFTETILQDKRFDDEEYDLNEDGERVLARVIKISEEALNESH